MNIVDVQKKIREHKHNYAEDFGIAVTIPARALLDELIDNPNGYSKEEADRIIQQYTDAIECSTTYDCLGWPLEKQLANIKKKSISQITKNAELYKKLLSESRPFSDAFLSSILLMALNETDSICHLLLNIEDLEYGVPSRFKLRTIIRDVFDKDTFTGGISGRSSILYEYNFGDLADVEVLLNHKDFNRYVLGNIVKNLHEHAFNDKHNKEIGSSSAAKSTFSYPRFLPNPFWAFFKLILKTVKSLRKKKTDITEEYQIKEKKVRIRFESDLNDATKINIYIENNGTPFCGDINSVFEDGVGEGTGIGLFSAKRYLDSVGGTISMYVNDSEYNVGFKINIPIL